MKIMWKKIVVAVLIVVMSSGLSAISLSAAEQEPVAEISVDAVSEERPVPEDSGEIVLEEMQMEDLADPAEVEVQDADAGLASEELPEESGEGAAVDIAAADIVLAYTELTYNGQARKPKVTVTCNGTTLKNGTDYSVSYTNNINAGKAAAVITGKGAYTGKAKAYFKINPKKATPAVKLSYTTLTYNGKVRKPSATVTLNGVKLKSADYSIAYASGRKNVGTYKVTVKLKGNYTGKKTVSFKILPKANKMASVAAGKSRIYAKWKKQTSQTSGYQVQCSLNKSFTSGLKTVTVRDTAVSSNTIKGLKALKNYYVRVRTFKTVNGKNYYSSWSKALSTKTLRSTLPAGYVECTDAYTALNRFRTTKKQWQWNADNKTYIVFNTNAGNTLKPLVRDADLEETALIRAKDLVQRFDHVRPNGEMCFSVYPGYLYIMGENIAAGFETAEYVTNAWAEENEDYEGQGHRRNMLNSDFTKVGIACFEKDGFRYWVQCFGG